jgi:hypothetical protein
MVDNPWVASMVVGLMDGIADPCGISVLIFLIAQLMLMSRKRILVAGILYSFAMFLVYFLFMYGLVNIPLSLVSSIRSFLILLFLIWGALEIKDFFFFKAFFSLEIPSFIKKKIEQLVEEATIPAIILVGVLASLGEIPCSSGFTIFFTLDCLPKYGITKENCIPYLIVYNFFGVLPLLLITFLVYYGIGRIERIQEKREKISRIIHLIAGLLLLSIALLMLFGVF